MKNHRIPFEALDQAVRAYTQEMAFDAHAVGQWWAGTTHEEALEVAMAALDRWFEMMEEQRRPDAAERNAQLVQAEIKRKEIERKIEEGGGF